MKPSLNGFNKKVWGQIFVYFQSCSIKANVYKYLSPYLLYLLYLSEEQKVLKIAKHNKYIENIFSIKNLEKTILHNECKMLIKKYRMR